jgi:osmotically-inducible protein OsmY
MRVLIVEDDEIIAGTMSRGLTLHGYVVDHVPSAEAASAALLTEQFDLAQLLRGAWPYVALMLVVLLGRLGSAVAQARPNVANEPAKTSLGEVVVTASRHLSDEQTTEQVEKALADDPFVYAEHVTVTTRNGRVVCEGIVGDVWDLRRVLRICRRASGSKHVVIDLRINDSIPEGG